MLVTVDGRTTVTVAKDPDTARWDRFQPRQHGADLSDEEKRDVAQSFEDAWDSWVDSEDAEERAEAHDFDGLYDDFRAGFGDHLEDRLVPVNLDSMPRSQFYGWVIDFIL